MRKDKKARGESRPEYIYCISKYNISIYCIDGVGFSKYRDTVVFVVRLSQRNTYIDTFDSCE
jgi:hypothetical protein